MHGYAGYARRWNEYERDGFPERQPLPVPGFPPLGFGPDLMCETLRTERQAHVGVRVGMSSWIGYSF